MGSSIFQYLVKADTKIEDVVKKVKDKLKIEKPVILSSRAVKGSFLGARGVLYFCLPE